MNRQLADNEDRRKNLHDFKKKICGIKKNFTDFQGFLWKKELKKALFLRSFEEFLMPIKAIINMFHFPLILVFREKILKKCRKKC